MSLSTKDMAIVSLSTNELQCVFSFLKRYYICIGSVCKEWNTVYKKSQQESVTNISSLVESVECLQYAHEYGYQYNWTTCPFAAMNGHLECLQDAHENGCEYAAENNHLECLNYLYENGCPGAYICILGQIGWGGPNADVGLLTLPSELKETEEYISLLKSKDQLVVNLSTTNLGKLSPSLFVGMTTVQEMYLSHMNQNSISANVFIPLTNLRILKLDHNHLVSLESGTFDTLEKLEELHLNNNHLETLPKRIFDQLKSLQKLYLNTNRLSNLNANLFHSLVNLQVLSLQQNSIRELPDNIFMNLNSLHILNLNENELTELNHPIVSEMSVLIPPLFDQMSELRELNLSVNHIQDLPHGVFGKLTKLHILDLAHNEIHRLFQFAEQGVFHELTSLWKLKLNNNKLDTIEEHVFDNLRNLTLLRLDSNQLTQLSKRCFDKLVYLTQLNLNENYISVVPPCLFDRLTRLKVLSINHNFLHQIQPGTFDKLENLQHLDLSLNLLKNSIISTQIQLIYQVGQYVSSFFSFWVNDPNEHLPLKIEGISSNLFLFTSKLQCVQLNHNFLEYLVPDTFRGIPNECDIDLSFVGLKQISEEFHQNLSNYKYVKLAGNPQLKSIPPCLYRYGQIVQN